MKQKVNSFRVLVAVFVLLIFLSLSISLLNYFVSLHATQNELAQRALPLSVDNIYTEIQTHVVEPSLVSSMMAHDTFVKDWLINEEQNAHKITRYLEQIKNKYGMFVTFLVSDQSKHYYTHNGFLEKMTPEKEDNKWYYSFKEIQEDHEINLDYNANLDNSLMMFINYKIFDENYHLIGATGIGHKISYIDDMLKRFREHFNFKVTFVDAKGDVVLVERRLEHFKNLSEDPALSQLQDQIISKESKIINYEKNGYEYLLKTKYIPELRLYLIVEAKIDDFTQTVNKTFYFNLSISLLVTIIIGLAMFITIKRYNKRLEYLAQHDGLTGLMNRRSFYEKIDYLYHLAKRKEEPLCIVFFDLDDFKKVNDYFGHSVGDRVLHRVAELLKEHLREVDLIARWGGEEFIVALNNTDIDQAKEIANKLRKLFEDDVVLHKLTKTSLTASFGVTETHTAESIDASIIRADQAMYEAKHRGKNGVATL